MRAAYVLDMGKNLAPKEFYTRNFRDIMEFVETANNNGYVFEIPTFSANADTSNAFRSHKYALTPPALAACRFATGKPCKTYYSIDVSTSRRQQPNTRQPNKKTNVAAFPTAKKRQGSHLHNERRHTISPQKKYNPAKLLPTCKAPMRTPFFGCEFSLHERIRTAI